VQKLLAAQCDTDCVWATPSYDAKALKSSIMAKRLPDGRVAIRGLKYELILPAEEGEALLLDPGALLRLKEALAGDVAKAIHAFLLNSGDPEQEPVLVMLPPSTNGMVNGVSGFTDGELKATTSSTLTNLRQPILSVPDGDYGNRYRPQALAAAALSRLDRVGVEELGSERLHEFAEKQPAEIRSRSAASDEAPGQSRNARGVALGHVPALRGRRPRADPAVMVGEWDSAAHPQPNAGVA
jgi:hypothetical protein